MFSVFFVCAACVAFEITCIGRFRLEPNRRCSLRLPQGEIAGWPHSGRPRPPRPLVRGTRDGDRAAQASGDRCAQGSCALQGTRTTRPGRLGRRLAFTGSDQEEARGRAHQKAVREEYDARRSRMGKDSGLAHWKLALWCEEQGLKAEANAHLRVVTPARADSRRGLDSPGL